MKLMQFADHLSNFASTSKPLETYLAGGGPRAAAKLVKLQDDLAYWMHFVQQFFSPRGVMRHSLWMLDESSNKQYEIPFSALPRYFHTHFQSGIKSMQLITEKGTEKPLPNNGHYIESLKSTFVYWFDNGSQVCYCAFISSASRFANYHSWLLQDTFARILTLSTRLSSLNS